MWGRVCKTLYNINFKIREKSRKLIKASIINNKIMLKMATVLLWGFPKANKKLSKYLLSIHHIGYCCKCLEYISEHVCSVLE